MGQGTGVDRQPPEQKGAGRLRAAEAPLASYNVKRDFEVTSEPAGRIGRPSRQKALTFVIQKHWASRLHYDFRLELDGVMVSWAGAVVRPGGQVDGDPCRGPPDQLQLVRGHDSQGPKRRWHRHRLGPGHLGACG